MRKKNKDSEVSTGYEHSNIYSNPLKSLKTLSKTFEITDKIGKALIGYDYFSIPTVVNCMSTQIKTPKHIHDNSNILISPKGTGRSSLLYHILAKSNPKFILSMDDKLYESYIVELPQEYFDRKVWIVDDMTTTFGGMSSKQRQQLMGFFVSFLSKKKYKRQNSDKELKGRISCQFGIAKENFDKKYAKEMFTSTFLDRLIPIRYEFTKEQIDFLLDQDENPKLPKLELPFRKRIVDIHLPSTVKEDIKSSVKRVISHGISVKRAKQYIENFLKCNALLNDRKEVCKDDMKLFKCIEPLHYASKPDTLETEIVNWLLKETTETNRVMGREIKNEFKDRYAETTISSTLSKLRESGRINSKKISKDRGYDHEFWI